MEAGDEAKRRLQDRQSEAYRALASTVLQFIDPIELRANILGDTLVKVAFFW